MAHPLARPVSDCCESKLGRYDGGDREKARKANLRSPPATIFFRLVCTWSASRSTAELAVYLSACMSVCLFVHPSVYPSICLSVCLSFHYYWTLDGLLT